MKKDSAGTRPTDESGGRKTAEILTLIDALRKLGVTRFSDGTLSIDLGPLPEVEEPVKPVDNDPKNREAPKRGKDKLTAQEQLDNYGVILDATE